jgi:FXSXX-COOH protein
MDNIAARSSNVADPEPSLADVTRSPADVTRMSLFELLLSQDTALANSLRRVVEDVDQPQEIIAAFGSYVR